MDPIVVKALAICAAHAIHFSGYNGCTVLTDSTAFLNQQPPGYVMGYDPGYEYCQEIQDKVAEEEQKKKDEAAKKQAAEDAPTLKAAARVLGVKLKDPKTGRLPSILCDSGIAGAPPRPCQPQTAPTMTLTVPAK